ncbi:hypothetical protein PWEIH_15978 [Listeria weihenstephanensis FSL R9-0317]|nr:hypothetical protein PWEIH_15978 [Listeria weihenstephanensis FSL R9-0317]
MKLYHFILLLVQIGILKLLFIKRKHKKRPKATFKFTNDTFSNFYLIQIYWAMLRFRKRRNIPPYSKNVNIVKPSVMLIG